MGPGRTLEGLELRRAKPIPHGHFCPCPLGRHTQVFVSGIPDTAGNIHSWDRASLKGPLAEQT